MSELDRSFLADAVANNAKNPLLEEIREKGADAVLAVYRVVKTALVHSLDNDAVRQTLEQSRGVLGGFASVIGANVSITFMFDTVFVCGQLLRASRQVYEAAIELGRILERCGATELSFEPSLTVESLRAFVASLVVAVRDAERREDLLRLEAPGVFVRAVEPSLRRAPGADVPARERIVDLYASALVVMRRFFDQVAKGSTILPQHVKRIAQSLVVLSETHDPMLLGMTALAGAHRDDAGRAVQSAILAVATGRQLTSSRVPLARLAMSALTADVGRVRLAGPIGRDRLVPLSDDLDERVPSVTAGVSVASGGVNLASAHRTAVTFEATWLERAKELGPLYGTGVAPLPDARILLAVRMLLDRIAPRDTARPASVLDALQQIAESGAIDPPIVRALVQAVGVCPAGSVVELDGGEWAVVLGDSSAEGASLDRPRVRVVTDGRGRALDAPIDLDLGLGQGNRKIVRLVDPTSARFNIAAVFLAAPAS